MSFHDKYLWMPRDPAFLSDGNRGLGTSSNIKEKRQPLWDAPEQELLWGRKKQAVDSIDNRPIPPNAYANSYLWDNVSSSQSMPTQFSDRLFESESFRTFDPVDKCISSAGDRNLCMERTGTFEQFGNELAVNLSLSHAMEDPLCLASGVGRPNENEIGNSSNSFAISMGHGRSYNTAENSAPVLCTGFQRSDSNFTFQPAYRKEDEYPVSLGQSPCSDVNMISNGQALRKSVDEFVLLGHQCSGGHGSSILHNVCDPQDRYCSTSLPYNKEHENFVMGAPSHGKSSGNFKCVDSFFGKRDAITTTTLLSNYTEDVTPVSAGVTYDAGSSSIPSMNQNHDDAGGTIISFGTEANDSTGGGVISSSDGLLSHSWTQDTEHPALNVYSKPDVNQVPNVIAAGKTGGAFKTESKKTPVNNFPSNVKSLLSTGILDEVPVKYVSWSREISLRGIIKGTGYMCDCSDCKFSKAVNAYEFERHAGCKTKHPNNHIYFENGKTIYSVVQELKSTPQELLFDVIQNVTGSPINEKNFRIWKVSYQAAARELERIYGKDDTIMPT